MISIHASAVLALFEFDRLDIETTRPAACITQVPDGTNRWQSRLESFAGVEDPPRRKFRPSGGCHCCRGASP